MTGLVKDLVWVGTRTEYYAEMVRFYRDALGLSPEPQEVEFAVFRLPDGGKAEVFGLSDTGHTRSSTEPVAGFLVNDVEAAREILEARGIEFLGPFTCGNLRGTRGRTFAARTATSTR